MASKWFLGSTSKRIKSLLSQYEILENTPILIIQKGIGRFKLSKFYLW